METTPSCFFSRHQFLILRLHSLSGLLPVGAYMVVHLLTNATVLAGAATFQDQVDKIHALGPAAAAGRMDLHFSAAHFPRRGRRDDHPQRHLEHVQLSVREQRPLYAAAGDRLDCPVLHLLPRLPDARLVPQRLVADERRRAACTAGQFDAEHATSSAALALRSVVVQVFYVIGVLSCVLPSVQWAVDNGHHLGRVDFAGCAAPGHLRLRGAGPAAMAVGQHGCAWSA